MKHSIKYFILTVFALCSIASGCSISEIEQDFPNSSSDTFDPESISLIFGKPDVDAEFSPVVGTKAGYDGYNGTDSIYVDTPDWTDWDKLVDGQMFYRLTIFVIDVTRDNALVAYRDLYQGSPDLSDGTDGRGQNGFCDINGNLLPGDPKYGDYAKVTFRHAHPMHGIAENSAEKLKGGEYKIVALANYSALNDIDDGKNGTKNYIGVNDEASTQRVGFETLVENVIYSFNAKADNGGLSNFTRNNPAYSPLFNYKLASVKIDASGNVSYDSQSGAVEQFVAGIRPQPLSLAKKVELKFGQNSLGMALVRTYSRVRITVKNKASQDDLLLNDLSLSTHFAQKNAYLLVDGETEAEWQPDRFNPDWLGTPVLTSSEAIKNVDAAGFPILIDNNPDNPPTAVVFDGYILESKIDEYKFNVNLVFHIFNLNLQPGSFITPNELFAALDASQSLNVIMERYNSTHTSNTTIETSGNIVYYENGSGIIYSELDKLAEIQELVNKDSETKYVWTLSRGPVNKNYVTIQKYGTKQYINITENELTPAYLSTNVMEYKTNSGSSGSNSIIFYRSKAYTGETQGKRYKDVNQYLGSLNDEKQILGGEIGTMYQGSFDLYNLGGEPKAPQFKFYKIDDSKSLDIPYVGEHPITSVGETTPISQILRNDFININISVSYERPPDLLPQSRAASVNTSCRHRFLGVR